MRYLVALVLLLAAATPVFAQHGVAGRQGWQPRLTKEGYDTDGRLEQSVTIETFGHSAISTLAALSQRTGVSLSVAPEDLTTVGERKVTIFAKSASLKQIMVRLPEALQECHWDIVLAEGKKPVYLLHRNSGTDSTIAWLKQRERRRQEQEGRSGRKARVLAAMEALAMSPEQLAELAKTDPHLVQSVKNPRIRPFLEAFLSLPEERMEQFLDTGRVEIDYGGVPSEIQQIIQSSVQKFYDETSKEKPKDPAMQKFFEDQATGFKTILDRLPASTFDFFDTHVLPSSVPWDPEIFYGMSITQSTQSGPNRKVVSGMGSMSDLIQPKYPSRENEEQVLGAITDGTGKDKATARGILAQWQQQKAAEEKRQVELRRQQECTEPTDPELLQTITLDTKETRELAQVQQLVAKKTGLTIISDYFTDRAVSLPAEEAAGMPLWRLLCWMGDTWDSKWQKAGSGLIFHRTKWFNMLQSEAPEALLVRCQEKLKTTGQLTLGDAAAIAVAVPDQLRENALPRDLQQAGLDRSSMMLGNWALQLYASLTPAQIKQASSPSGLALTDMAITQQQQVRMMVFAPEADKDRVRFYIEKAVEKSGAVKYTLSLRLPEETSPQMRCMFTFPTVRTEPSPAAGANSSSGK